MSYPGKKNIRDFLTCEGESGQMIRSFNWASTPIGAISDWPQSLKTSVNLMLNSRTPAWIAWGAEKIFLYNDAYINILGINKHPKALGQPIPATLEDSRNEYKDAIDNVYINGITITLSTDKLSIDHEGFTAEKKITETITPVFGEDNNVAGVFCQASVSVSKADSENGIDKAISKKIEETELKFRTLVHRAPVGIVILKGNDLIFDTANDAYLSIFKKERKDVIGRKLTDVLPHLQDSAVVDGLLTVLTTGKNYQYTNRPVHFVDGYGNKSIRYFNSTHQPLIENNIVTGVISVVNEVTEEYLSQKIREQNEKDLAMILGTIPHIAFRTKPDGMVTYYNERYFTYTGLDPEKALNDGWKPTIHPDMLEEVENQWRDSIRTGKDYTAAFLIKRASDGMYRWHLSQAAALCNENGEITEWIGTLTDIHEQKMFEVELEAKVRDRTKKLNHSNKLLGEKNRELEKTNAELESFNYVASHDLQEPLRKIQTFISMIREWNLEGEAADKYMTKIYTSADRMSQLIQDMLTYSCISADENFVKTDLNSIIANILQDFELTINEKNAIIETEPLPIITAIPRQMHQLFTNLISNSLKYSDKKTEIKINGTILEAKNSAGITKEYLEIVFSDNGIGFDPQYSEQIFRLFQRLHSKTEYSGTGVGLSICKKIVEQHQGSITAISTLGKGATFIIKLPA